MWCEVGHARLLKPGLPYQHSLRLGTRFWRIWSQAHVEFDSELLSRGRGAAAGSACGGRRTERSAARWVSSVLRKACGWFVKSRKEFGWDKRSLRCLYIALCLNLTARSFLNKQEELGFLEQGVRLIALSRRFSGSNRTLALGDGTPVQALGAWDFCVAWACSVRFATHKIEPVVSGLCPTQGHPGLEQARQKYPVFQLSLGIGCTTKITLKHWSIKKKIRNNEMTAGIAWVLWE